MTRPGFAASYVESAQADLDLAALAEDCLKQLGDQPDLALVFLSADHAFAAEKIAEQLCGLLGTENLLGCTAESLVSGARELESVSAAALWVARLPDPPTAPFELRLLRTPDGPSIVGWPEALDGPWDPSTMLLVLGDPFSFPADLLLERLNEDRPKTLVFGGMASGGMAPGESRLILGPRVLDAGAVALAMPYPDPIRTVVSQGCRPIGEPFVVTAAEANVIQQLGGKPALQQLQGVVDALANSEKELLRGGLHLGRVVNEYQERFEQGDFLVRNVTAIDRESGSIQVGDFYRAGQTVQFHVRDQQTAADELKWLLARIRDDRDFQPRGGLMFTCNGRGTRLFSEPDHDAGLVAKTLGPLPLAGFFAQGELGPIRGLNFLHGFTASIVLFG